MGKNSISVYSPIGGLAGGFNVGGGSQPSAPSVHPNVEVCENKGDAPGKSTFGDKSEQTPVSVEEVQLATGFPESYSDADEFGFSKDLVGGLGNPPKP